MIQSKYSTKQHILNIFFALVSTLALFANVIIPTEDLVNATVGEGPYIFRGFLQLIAKICCTLPETNISALVVFIGLIFLYRYYFKMRLQNQVPKSKIFFALAALFALFMIIGMSFQTFNSAAFITQNKFQALYSFTIWMGFTILFYVVLMLIVYQIQYGKKPIPYFNKIADFLLEKRPILIPFCFLLICWLPYWIVFFPGSINWDMADQFLQYVNYNGQFSLNQHHPILSTLMYGKIIQIGSKIHNMVTGIAFGTLLQTLFLIVSITCGIYYMKKWGVSKRIRLYTLLFCALNPLFGCWIEMLVKDCAYFGIFFLFVVFLLDLIQKILNAQPFKETLLLTGLFGVLSMIRNNGIYITVCSLLALVFICKNKKDRFKIFISSIIVGCVIMLITNGLMNIYQTGKGSIGEALSIPFQQTARYVRDYPNEVTAEERIIIDSVLDYNSLATAYNPNISDPIKLLFKRDGNLQNYFKVWFKMFFKHPGVYFEATINNIYAYLCPNTESPTGQIVTYNAYTDMIEFFNVNFHPFYHITDMNGFFDVNFIFPDQIRKFFFNLLIVLKKIPGIGLLWHVGTYTWIVLFLAALAIYMKKYYLLVGCVPTFMSLLCCIASPVNGYFRYAIPHMLTTPILIGWFIVNYNYKNKTNKSTQKEEKKCKIKTKKLQS